MVNVRLAGADHRLGFDMLQAVSLGLIENRWTPDRAELTRDNWFDGRQGLADLGYPNAMERCCRRPGVIGLGDRRRIKDSARRKKA